MSALHAQMGRVAALPALCAGLFLAGHARADELSIATTEHGDWATSVAALQTEGTDGATLHVVVRDGDAAVGCDRYTLRLDDVGAAAFTVGACDPVSGATTLTLTSRHALFAHEGVVARPLAVGITAVEVRSVGARGGAGEQAGSTEHCTIDVHPYVVDPETHAQVALLAPRFAIRVRGSDVEAEPTADGFHFTAHEAGNLTVAYDVVDTTDGSVVTSEHAELSCSGGPDAAITPVITPPVAAAAAPAPSAPASSDDDTRGSRFALTIAPSFHWLEPGVFAHRPATGTPPPAGFDGVAATGADADFDMFLLGDFLYVLGDVQFALGSALGRAPGSTVAGLGTMLVAAVGTGFRFAVSPGLHVSLEMLFGVDYASLAPQDATSTYVGFRSGVDWRFGSVGVGVRFGYALVEFEASDFEGAATATLYL